MELHLLNLLLVLLAAWAAGSVAERLGYPSILGELLAGILLGPPLLGLLHSQEALGVLAELGVLLMMMYIGMEIDPRELGRASWAGFLAAIGGFFTPFVAGFLVIRAFGGTMTAGLFVGIAVGVTSLATKSRILVDLKLLDTRIAHVLMAGALVSDTLALVVFAAVIGVAESGSVSPPGLVAVGGRAILFFGACGLAGYRLLPWIGRRLHETGYRNRTLLFTFMLLTGFLFAELAELAGLHAILGTFLAGLFLRDAIPDRKLTFSLTSVLRDVSIGFLAPIFFVIAGFEVSLAVIGGNLPLFLAVMAAAVFGKIAGTLLFYLPTGHGWREGLTIGAGMNGRGAVEIVIAGIGLQRGLISQEIFSILVFMAIFTTATVPFLLKWCTDWLDRRGELARASTERKGTIIVGGGATARLIADFLKGEGPLTIVDSNPYRCEMAQRDGFRTLCGNALREEVLSEAGAAQARSLIAMTSNPEVNVLAAQLAREVFLVPFVHVTMAGADRGAHEDLIRPLEATTLFAAPADIATWDHVVDQGTFRIRRIPVPREVAGGRSVFRPSDWLEEAMGLPLMVRSGEGTELFHSGSKVSPGDTVICLAPLDEEGHRGDEFDRLVDACRILDIPGGMEREDFFELASEALAEEVGGDRGALLRQLLLREEVSIVLGSDLAVPHVRLPSGSGFHLLMARCREGVHFATAHVSARAVFLFASAQDEPTIHLRALSAVAQIAQNESFMERWMEAEGPDELRELVLKADRRRFPGVLAASAEGEPEAVP
jgi:Kef-type K+ transport system membrane component KefB/mannitol/fructose-specific phosphotransferase system IIA component (Ntr-type)